MKHVFTICVVVIASFLFVSCEKKEKTRDLSIMGQIVDSSNAAIANTTFVLYTEKSVRKGSSVDFDKTSFSFVTDGEGKFRVQITVPEGAKISIIYAGENYGSTPLIILGWNSLSSGNEIDAGVIIARDKFE